MEKDREKLSEVIFPLLQWFEENARVLPWRSEPTPYRVWISEIMLQQTRVAAVLGYFSRFMDELPTVADLAAVEEERLLKLWQGLGYYNRARNLQKAARQIMTEFGGQFPSDYDSIRSLAGVGDYTAGAVASIAFGTPVPAVDGNVLRVLARILGDTSDIALQDTKDKARALLLEVIPINQPGNFNQALMELGATVCLPNGVPLCGQCPVRSQCEAYQSDQIGQLPVKHSKKARRMERRLVYLIFHDGHVALRRRPNKGLLAGLWEYPNELMDGTYWPTVWGIHSTSCERGCTGKHVFTHIEWQMESMILSASEIDLPEGWVWADGPALRDIYAVPNAFQSFEMQVQQRIHQF